jgi:hypothetical protein
LVDCKHKSTPAQFLPPSNGGHGSACRIESHRPFLPFSPTLGHSIRNNLDQAKGHIHGIALVVPFQEVEGCPPLSTGTYNTLETGITLGIARSSLWQSPCAPFHCPRSLVDPLALHGFDGGASRFAQLQASLSLPTFEWWIDTDPRGFQAPHALIDFLSGTMCRYFISYNRNFYTVILHQIRHCIDFPNFDPESVRPPALDPGASRLRSAYSLSH